MDCGPRAYLWQTHLDSMGSVSIMHLERWVTPHVYSEYSHIQIGSLKISPHHHLPVL